MGPEPAMVADRPRGPPGCASRSHRCLPVSPALVRRPSRGGHMTRPRSSARYVGFDVHKHLVVACVIDARGHVLLRQSFACTHAEIESFARLHLRATDKLALEA